MIQTMPPTSGDSDMAVAALVMPPAPPFEAVEHGPIVADDGEPAANAAASCTTVWRHDSLVHTHDRGSGKRR
ncbi:MAG: hypothetical protein R2854_01590 [Caldilineaceae bacterium]